MYVTSFQLYTICEYLHVRREKKRRKQASNAGDGKPETIHTTTIMMMSCLILSLPYDLPSYLPALLTTLLRFGHTLDA